MFPKSNKKLNKVLIFILIVLLVGIAAMSVFLFHFALNPGSSFTMTKLLLSGEVEPAPHDTPVEETEAVQQWRAYCKEASQWYLSEGQDAELTDPEGLTLKGRLFPQEDSHRYAIVCHGYGGNGAQMSAYAKRFYDMGCSVLVPDARAHGESGGKYYGMGWLERKDLLGWIDQIITDDPEGEILLFGVSMGGATVMMTAGEPLPPQVKCIIEDCGYTSVWDEFSVQIHALFNAPDFPFLYTCDWVCRIMAGYGFKEASSVEQLKKAQVPVLFIHGEEDTFVPYSMLDEVYTACASPVKEKLTVPNAAHGTAAYTDPELYWGTVEDFVNRQFS